MSQRPSSPRRPRILFLVASLESGGAERTVCNLVDHLAPRIGAGNVTVAVFSLRRAHYRHLGRQVDLDCPSAPGAIAAAGQLVRRVVRLARLLRRYRPRRIVAFAVSANLTAILATLLTGRVRSLVVSMRGDPERYRGWVQQSLIRHLYRLPRRVVALSRGVRDQMVDRYGLDADQVCFIPNPICAFPPTSSAGAAEAASLGPYVLAVGRLHPDKGLDVLIEAFAAIADRHPRLRLVVLGEGPMHDELVRRIDAGPGAGRVLLLGTRQEVEPWYRNTELFVLPSRSEGWGNALVEAMACGCACLATRTVGPLEIISDGEDGVLVPIGDAQALAAAMHGLLCDSPSRVRLGQRARQQAGRYTTGPIVASWLRS